MSTEGMEWLNRRVRVYSAHDWRKEGPPMAEGVVVAYAANPTICVRRDDGTQSDWQITLPIDVLAEDAEIPLSRRDLAVETFRRVQDLQAALRALWPDRTVVYFSESGGQSMGPGPVLTSEESQLLSRVADAIAEARKEMAR